MESNRGDSSPRQRNRSQAVKRWTYASALFESVRLYLHRVEVFAGRHRFDMSLSRTIDSQRVRFIDTNSIIILLISIDANSYLVSINDAPHRFEGMHPDFLPWRHERITAKFNNDLKPTTRCKFATFQSTSCFHKTYFGGKMLSRLLARPGHQGAD